MKMIAQLASSRAGVRFVGDSSLSMTYQYTMVNTSRWARM